jgi:hypothetical protein
VLKKAGTVVAAAAACLLAVSPLAFAGDDGDRRAGHGSEGTGSVEQTAIKGGDQSEGPFSLADNNSDAPMPACNSDAANLAVDVEDIAGALGNAEADSGESSGESSGEKGGESSGEKGDEESRGERTCE